MCLSHAFYFGVQTAFITRGSILAQNSFADQPVDFGHGGLVDLLGGSLVTGLHRR